jgi:hypothetical protein
MPCYSLLFPILLIIIAILKSILHEKLDMLLFFLSFSTFAIFFQLCDNDNIWLYIGFVLLIGIIIIYRNTLIDPFY